MSRTREEIQEELEQLQEEKESLENGDNEEEYEQMLNDVYGEIDVCGYKYDAARLLKEVDPTAYRCGMNDYNDSRISDLECQIEDLEQELKDLDGVEE